LNLFMVFKGASDSGRGIRSATRWTLSTAERCLKLSFPCSERGSAKSPVGDGDCRERCRDLETAEAILALAGRHADLIVQGARKDWNWLTPEDRIVPASGLAPLAPY
jgi:hypothetical protein